MPVYQKQNDHRSIRMDRHHIEIRTHQLERLHVYLHVTFICKMVIKNICIILFSIVHVWLHSTIDSMENSYHFFIKSFHPRFYNHM